jgi:HK97 family phage prohead protease
MKPTTDAPATDLRTKTAPLDAAPSAEHERLYLPGRSTARSVTPGERLLEVTITTRDRDREGDIVEPSGLDFEAFLQNPVVLWAHDLGAPPVGRVRSVRVLDERVDATVQFADTLQGREVFELYRQGFLNAWSIGFLPRTWQPLPREDEDPRPGFHITAAEVVELSAVPVPANPAALTRALAAGRIVLGEGLRRELDLHEPKPLTPTESATPDAPASLSPRGETRPTRRIAVRTAVRAARGIALGLMRRELLRAAAVARGEL